MTISEVHVVTAATLIILITLNYYHRIVPVRCVHSTLPLLLPGLRAINPGRASAARWSRPKPILFILLPEASPPSVL